MAKVKFNLRPTIWRSGVEGFYLSGRKKQAIILCSVNVPGDISCPRNVKIAMMAKAWKINEKMMGWNQSGKKPDHTGLMVHGKEFVFYTKFNKWNANSQIY